MSSLFQVRWRSRLMFTAVTPLLVPLQEQSRHHPGPTTAQLRRPLGKKASHFKGPWEVLCSLVNISSTEWGASEQQETTQSTTAPILSAGSIDRSETWLKVQLKIWDFS
jgi:hypothetical protein